MKQKKNKKNNPPIILMKYKELIIYIRKGLTLVIKIKKNNKFNIIKITALYLVNKDQHVIENVYNISKFYYPLTINKLKMY